MDRAEGHKLQQTTQTRGHEELPLAQGQGRRPRVPGCDDGTEAAERSYPTSKIRGGGQEKLPHVQGAAAQKGREELLHVQGQEGQP